MGIDFKDGKMTYSFSDAEAGDSGLLSDIAEAGATVAGTALKTTGIVAASTTVAVGATTVGAGAGTAVAAAAGVGVASYALVKTAEESDGVEHIKHSSADASGGQSYDLFIQDSATTTTASTGSHDYVTTSTADQGLASVSELLTSIGMEYDGDVVPGDVSASNVCLPQATARHNSQSWGREKR